MSVGVIVGAIVGCFLGIIIVGTLILCIVAKTTEKAEEENQQ